MNGTFLEKTVGKCEEKDTEQIKGHKLRRKREGFSLGTVCSGAQRGYLLGGVLTQGHAKLIYLKTYFEDTALTL